MSHPADAFMSIFGFKRATCADCKCSSPSLAYPMRNCELRPDPVQPNDQCVMFKQSDEETQEDEWTEVSE